MKLSDKIKELERRLRELEQAPRMYPVYVPYYVQPPVYTPAPSYPWRPTEVWCQTGNYSGTAGIYFGHQQ